MLSAKSMAGEFLYLRFQKASVLFKKKVSTTSPIFPFSKNSIILLINACLGFEGIHTGVDELGRKSKTHLLADIKFRYKLKLYIGKSDTISVAVNMFLSFISRLFSSVACTLDKIPGYKWVFSAIMMRGQRRI